MAHLNRIQATASADNSRSRPGADDLRGLGVKTFFRPSDAAELGVDSRGLRRLLDDGSVERVARGVYRLADAEPTEHYSLAAVCTRVPGAIICLLSALSVHGLGTQLPREVWIAIPHKARTPRLPELPVKVVRFSGASLRYGVGSTAFEGVPARITSPARTVVGLLPLPAAGRQGGGAGGVERRPAPAQGERRRDLARGRGLPREVACRPGPGSAVPMTLARNCAASWGPFARA